MLIQDNRLKGGGAPLWADGRTEGAGPYRTNEGPDAREKGNQETGGGSGPLACLLFRPSREKALLHIQPA